MMERQRTFICHNIPNDVTMPMIKSALRQYNIGAYIAINERTRDKTRFCKINVETDTQAEHLENLREVTVGKAVLVFQPDIHLSDDQRGRQKVSNVLSVYRQAQELGIDLRSVLLRPETTEHTYIPHEMLGISTNSSCTVTHTLEEKSQPVLLFKTSRVDMRTNRIKDRPKEDEYIDAIQPSRLDVTFPETPLAEIEKFYSNSTPSNMLCNLPLNLSVTPITPDKVETGTFNLEMKRLAEERQRRKDQRQGGTPLSSKPVKMPNMGRIAPVQNTKPAIIPKNNIPVKEPMRSPSPAKPSFIPKFTPPPILKMPPKTSSTVLPPTPPNTPLNKTDGRVWDLPYQLSLYLSKEQLDHWCSPCRTEPILDLSSIDVPGLEATLPTTSDRVPDVLSNVSEDDDCNRDLLTFFLKDVDEIIITEDYTHLAEISIQAQQLLDSMVSKGVVWDLLAGTDPIQNKIETVMLVKELEDAGDDELAQELREAEGLEEDVKTELESCRADLLFFKLKNAIECLDSRGHCV